MKRMAMVSVVGLVMLQGMAHAADYKTEKQVTQIGTDMTITDTKIVLPVTPSWGVYGGVKNRTINDSGGTPQHSDNTYTFGFHYPLK